MLSTERVELLDIKEQSCPRVYISLLNLLVLTALELHRLTPIEHTDHSDGCGKTGYWKVTIIEPNSRKDTKPTASNMGHICGSGKSPEKNVFTI